MLAALARSDSALPAPQVLGFACDDRDRLGRPMDFCDIYHSANRFSSGHKTVPIVLPRSILWSFDRARLVIGREALLLQGQSVESDVADNTTEPQMQDLAGNAFLYLKLDGFNKTTGNDVQIHYHDE